MDHVTEIAMGIILLGGIAAATGAITHWWLQPSWRFIQTMRELRSQLIPDNGRKMHEQLQSIDERTGDIQRELYTHVQEANERFTAIDKHIMESMSHE